MASKKNPTGAIADDAVADLEIIRKQLDREIRKALAKLNTAPGEDTLVKQQGRVAAQVASQIDATMKAKGLKAITGVLRDRAIESALAALGGVDLPVSVESAVDQILKSQTKDIADVFGDASSTIRKAIALGTTTSASLSDLIEGVAEKVGATVTKAQAAVDASVMAAGRTAVIRAATEAADGLVDLVYLYSGPEDSRNRPFCRVHVGKALTESGIAQANNGQGLPVDAFAGGYNCRHVWSPMTMAEARRRGIEILE
jgi:hypothetical protein